MKLPETSGHFPKPIQIRSNSIHVLFVNPQTHKHTQKHTKKTPKEKLVREFQTRD
jgi:hypothetical protein